MFTKQILLVDFSVHSLTKFSQKRTSGIKSLLCPSRITTVARTSLTGSVNLYALTDKRSVSGIIPSHFPSLFDRRLFSLSLASLRLTIKTGTLHHVYHRYDHTPYTCGFLIAYNEFEGHPAGPGIGSSHASVDRV